MSQSATGGRRRLDSSVPPEYDLPTREPRIDSPIAARFVMFLVFIGWVVGTAGSATAIIAVDTPVLDRATFRGAADGGLRDRADPSRRRLPAHLVTDDGRARGRRGDPRDQHPAGCCGCGDGRARRGLGRARDPTCRHRDRRRSASTPCHWAWPSAARWRWPRGTRRSTISASTSRCSRSLSAWRSPWSGTSAPACTAWGDRTSRSWPASPRWCCWCSSTAASCVRTDRSRWCA